MKNSRQILIIALLAALVAGAIMLPGSGLARAAGLALADFEGGPPAGWFAFAGGSSSVNTSTQVVADSDTMALPGQAGNNEILAAGFSVADFGGFGQEYASGGGPEDWSTYESFNFWFYGSGSGLAYQAEISDNRSDPNNDTSERFDYTFTDDAAGWRYIRIPFTDFNRATDFQPGGAPNDGFTLTEVWAWAIVLPGGADTVYFDDFFLGPRIVDDFEALLNTGVDGDGVDIGFYTFAGPDSSIAFQATDTAPALPALGWPNRALQLDIESTAYAGIIHGFENAAVDTWISQDWSDYAGLSLWIYGNNSDTELFIDLLENRNPGSTTDDAERWTVTFVDDFAGWRQFDFPFNTFVAKPIGNGAPNDGLTLDEVHGWAFGTLGTGGARTYYLDNVSLYGVAEVPELAVNFGSAQFEATEGDTATITVKLNRDLGDQDGDPASVSVDYSTEPGTAVAGRDYTPAAGTLTFVQGGPKEQSFTVPTFDNPKHDGDKTVILRLANPVDVAPGMSMQSVLSILDDDPLDRTLLDDFERGAYLWTGQNVNLSTPEIAAGDALEVPGQAAYEHILQVETPAVVDLIIGGTNCKKGNGVIPVAILTTPDFDALSVDHNTVRLGDAAETHRDKTGAAKRHVEDFDRDGDRDLVFHFRASETGYPCPAGQMTLTGQTFAGRPILYGGTASFGRDFPIGQNWTRGAGLSFWYYGSNSGDEITLTLKDNRAPDPGAPGWNMVWSDEFNEPAGTPPNPAIWSYEIGDGAANGILGWGNSELQYYTDSTENSATDGAGNLVITLKEANGDLVCYYGPCEYTSARLISQYKAEFAYGRIESRILVPDGGPGLWPAFWSLGTDIGEVGWPQTGEIDIMEYVSRLPNEIFGTIHGPGYSGGNSFGNTYTFPGLVADNYHTFAIEWTPNLINWYVDGILYHTATPSDVAPNQWVFNDPVFLILNMAVGGNFGGSVGEDTTFPQAMKVDYVRVYQGPDTAERWEATFMDTFTGWQRVEVPFSALTRSANQPAGAPDDGLTLSEVWGYGFELPADGTSDAMLRFDQVRLELLPPPPAITVTNLNDNGPGSLRQALLDIAEGGTITFDPALAGGTLSLTTGPLWPGRNVTIDGSGAPGLVVNGGGGDRVLIVNAGQTVNVAYLALTNGYGFQLAGGILNNGNLTLDHVTVSGNTMTTNAGDFWQGGGGIYSGDGATLTLRDSTVADNTSGHDGGGVYSFFNTTTIIERSTISANVSQNVGGGLRLLGNATIVNSTISGNQSVAWHGGALFITDGVVDTVNSTIAANVSAGGTADVFVGTFGPSSATLTLANTIVSSSGGNCFFAPWGSGIVTLTADHNNVFTDASCFAGASDQVVGDVLLGPLGDNGGPTATHALLAGSPAIDAGDPGICPVTDQRGVTRDAACDTGAFEFAAP